MMDIVGNSILPCLQLTQFSRNSSYDSGVSDVAESTVRFSQKFAISCWLCLRLSVRAVGDRFDCIIGGYSRIGIQKRIWCPYPLRRTTNNWDISFTKTN